MVRAPGPGGSTRLIHLSGSVCVLRPEAGATLEAIVGGPSRPPAPPDDLVAALLRERVIRAADAGPGRREATRSALADRILRPALVAAGRSRHRTRRARRLLRTARWGVALFGWADTVRVWDRCCPQPTPATGFAATLDEIDRCVRRAAANSLLGHRCKERALACAALARWSGHRAGLVIGVRDFPVAAHVWTECSGRILSDEPAHCAGFRPVARYDGSGVTGGA